MRILDSRFYRVAEVATNFLLLNLLWLVVALPVVTIFPATTALFGVLKVWEEREGAGVVGPFFATFREKIWPSLLIGVAWAAIGGVLIVDLIASRRIGGGLASLLLIAAGLMTLVHGAVTVYLFPTIANARTTPLGMVRNAGLLALSQPIASLVAAIGLVAVAIAIYLVPFLLLFAGSIVAYGLNALFRRAVGNFPAVEPPAAVPAGSGAADQIPAGEGNITS